MSSYWLNMAFDTIFTLLTIYWQADSCAHFFSYSWMPYDDDGDTSCLLSIYHWLTSWTCCNDLWSLYFFLGQFYMWLTHSGDHFVSPCAKLLKVSFKEFWSKKYFLLHVKQAINITTALNYSFPIMVVVCEKVKFVGSTFTMAVKSRNYRYDVVVALH